MREGGRDGVTTRKRFFKANHLGDAITQIQSRGMRGFVAGEVEVGPPGTHGSDAEGVADAHISTALWATVERAM